MSNRFGQFDGAVHRVDLPPGRFDAALLATVRTLHLPSLLESHIGGPCGLNHLAQSLANFVGGNLDLIEMGRPDTLFFCLDLGGHLSGLLQQIGKFFIQQVLIRIHAMISQKLPGQRQPA
ncbi:MAG: hypothetical protein ACF8CQ_24865 [Rhodopirellula sp. JB044]|jgi:hypothetical protein|uniref:hypothetical protein n=1 Tax=Rhodopirellula sp. JB044 TaxID=3342844 RepID=UPI00370B581C